MAALRREMVAEKLFVRTRQGVYKISPTLGGPVPARRPAGGRPGPEKATQVG